MVSVALPGVPLAVRTTVPPIVAVCAAVGPVPAKVPVELAAVPSVCGTPVLNTTKSLVQLAGALILKLYLAGNCPGPTVPSVAVFGNDIAQSRLTGSLPGLGFFSPRPLGFGGVSDSSPAFAFMAAAMPYRLSPCI